MILAKRLGIALVFGIMGSAGPLQAAIPTQFIAKMYTEVLGRAPDTAGWNSAVSYFQSNACSQSTLTTWGRSVFSSSEFASDGNNNAAIVLILYRAILNREPDTGGFSTYTGDLNNGSLSLTSAVSLFFGTSEFAGDVSQICSGGSYSFELGGQAVAIPIPGQAYYSQVTLQNALCTAGQAAANSHTPTTVYLAQQSVVLLSSTLQIPPLVTLATSGQPSPHQHALMARLVRNTDANGGAFAGPMVEIEVSGVPVCSNQYSAPAGLNGGSLRNVWVDGSRAATSAFAYYAINVQIDGGINVVVDSNFLADSRGWSTLHSFGSLDLYPDTCSSNTITNNIITAYPAQHSMSSNAYTDGLSIGCEHSTVENNGIVDPTDVGIVVFTAGDTATQQSTVSNNTIVSAGNSAFAALAFDPLWYRSTGSGYVSNNTFPSFAGASIASNTFWSGANTHYIIGLSVGSMAWFMDLLPPPSTNAPGVVGTGASATSNTTAGITTTMGIGIAVSGMQAATVQSNTFTRAALPSNGTNGVTTCNQANIDATSGILAVVTPTGGTTRDTASSGNIQSPSVDVALLNPSNGAPCMGSSL